MKLFGTIFVTQDDEDTLKECLDKYDELRHYEISATKIPQGRAISKKLTIKVKGKQDQSLLESVLQHDLQNRITITSNFEIIAERLFTEFLRFTKERLFHYLSIWLATVGAIYLAFYSVGFLGHILEVEWYVHLELVGFSVIPSGAELFNQFYHFREGRINNND